MVHTEIYIHIAIYRHIREASNGMIFLRNSFVTLDM